MNLIKTGLLFGLTVLILLSCNRRSKLPEGYELYTSVDYSLASSEFSSISNLVGLEARSDSGIYRTEALFCPNAIRTVDFSNPNVPIMVIDFTTGSTCIDGRTRSGRLIAEFHGKWTQQNSYINITPSSYSVNGLPIDFEKRVTNNGRNIDGKMIWGTTVDNGIITTSLGSIFYQESRHTTWIEGEGGSLWDYSDNVYEITGTASGTARNGVPFNVNVDSPLLVKFNCAHIVQGVITVSPTGLTDRTIDYGVGSCDNVAVLTLGDYQAEITLP